MKIKLLKIIAEEIGLNHFKEFDVNPDSWGWKSDTFIDLTPLIKSKILKLRGLFSSNEKIHGTKVIIKDIDTWLSVLEGGAGGAKARNIRQFEPLLIALIGGSNGHRIYKQFEELNEIYICYYVSEIRFYPETRDRGYTTPAYVEMKIIWEEFGGKHVKNIDFEYSDIHGRSVVEALAIRGFYIETPELRETYLDQMKRFGVTVKQIGKQYLANGQATDDNMDGNPDGRENSWFWRRANVFQMERDGGFGRVLIDVFKESNEKEDREERVSIPTWFWSRVENVALIKKSLKKVIRNSSDEDFDVNQEDIEDLDIETSEIEIPIHPFLAIFDLRRHLRLKIHIDLLTEYIYDPEISEKLILPKYLKDLVSMLIEYKESKFNDIIEGKSGGMVVLLSGPPGTGKTLTAEVYAESEERGLYSVQCSQLGTDPESLEDELLKIFTRAQRWNAILLLDEADVYVRERGSDLQQNAIVGVFLRVLEYQSNILFLTTNRPDDVDDAIASRCVARLNYKIPSQLDQVLIWEVLAKSFGIQLEIKTIDEIVADNPNLSGRDVKNLLKLAYLISSSRKIPISTKVIKFVRQFKPTRSDVPTEEIEELDLLLEGKKILKRKFTLEE